MTYDSKLDTIVHIEHVKDFLYQVREELKLRGKNHDASKLVPPEKNVFDRQGDKLKDLVFNSPEYKESLKELGPALTHHYFVNSHHPDHYKNGISDMTLLDLIEMLADWKASTLRVSHGDLKQSILSNHVRFNMPEYLTNMLLNTARELGWLDNDAK